jgi:hypothetical protein
VSISTARPSSQDRLAQKFKPREPSIERFGFQHAAAIGTA